VPAGWQALSRYQLRSEEQTNNRPEIIGRDSEIHLPLCG